MMIKIKNLLDDGMNYIEFKTKEEWDTYCYKFRPYRGYYNPQPFYMTPPSFPCLMIYDSCAIICNYESNDEFMNFFLSEGNYSIEEDNE